MRQRVLLAEDSDTIRGVAESLLRQSGYELIAVSSGEKALEVLEFTRPDLIILSSQLKGKGNKLVYESIKENQRTANIPFLILSDNEESGLPFSEDSIIEKPLDPKEFSEKINVFLNQNIKTATDPESKNPLNDASLEDEFLDAALGLDNLEITDSEDMDKTKVSSVSKKSKPAEKMIGIDHVEEDTDVSSISGKVESLMIHDEHSEIKQSEKSKTATHAKMGGTGKLEILNDQFGLVDPISKDIQNENRDHDYSWFLNELKKENDTDFIPTGADSKHLSESQNLKFEDNSKAVDPITPVIPDELSIEKTGQGVDSFIDEFKKEVEKIHSDTPGSVSDIKESEKIDGSGKGLTWEDSFEKINPKNIEFFSRQFVAELAERIAGKFADKIDSEKLMKLIKDEIIKKIQQGQ